MTAACGPSPGPPLRLIDPATGASLDRAFDSPGASFGRQAYIEGVDCEGAGMAGAGGHCVALCRPHEVLHLLDTLNIRCLVTFGLELVHKLLQPQAQVPPVTEHVLLKEEVLFTGQHHFVVGRLQFGRIRV